MACCRRIASNVIAKVYCLARISYLYPWVACWPYSMWYLTSHVIPLTTFGISSVHTGFTPNLVHCSMSVLHGGTSKQLHSCHTLASYLSCPVTGWFGSCLSFYCLGDFFPPCAIHDLHEGVEEGTLPLITISYYRFLVVRITRALTPAVGWVYGFTRLLSPRP